MKDHSLHDARKGLHVRGTGSLRLPKGWFNSSQSGVVKQGRAMILCDLKLVLRGLAHHTLPELRDYRNTDG